MESLTIKTVKAKAMKKQRKIQSIANVLRLLEILVVLAVLSRFSLQLPVSLEYIKDLTLILASPRFVFVVGNVIVIVLFAKSGHLPGLEGKGNGKSSDLYEEFMEMSGKSAPVAVVKKAAAENRRKQSVKLEVPMVKEEFPIVKIYNRSQSEKIITNSQPIVSKPEKELRRSATENLARKENKKDEKGEFPEDDMSNEEFKSAIDAFIERQKRFRRDEENSVFV